MVASDIISVQLEGVDKHEVEVMLLESPKPILVTFKTVRVLHKVFRRLFIRYRTSAPSLMRNPARCGQRMVAGRRWAQNFLT